MQTTGGTGQDVSKNHAHAEMTLQIDCVDQIWSKSFFTFYDPGIEPGLLEAYHYTELHNEIDNNEMPENLFEFKFWHLNFCMLKFDSTE